ncbi:selenide, water dikinase SelD [Arundinibacter roseus]|uniref:Selenide, water dikinase n=1 Tax=Arundinibacter roseus TaxID=2070510 RepID=A0A4R4K1Q4_9BACT|nr:selenide, water dikinase SelD [Arundinibacter roseus]TDB61188.1 selenide, water dikinase SelD [Arundinibacter roseus]
MTDLKDPILLTQYSHGAGCGCKISPQILDRILHGNDSSVQLSATPAFDISTLLVGNNSRDDAAVMDLGNGEAIISTTDFFMPIVDDAFDFGRIASANAISDVYAMGGQPLMAIAILGWPIDKLSPEVAGRVIEGSRAICAEAGIPLAGGHSIDSPEPIFGLAVTGRVSLEHLKRNDTATEGCLLYLTKKIGVGILTTAQKKGILAPEHAHLAPDQMRQLNKVGGALGALTHVKALTDVTGFGLLGHLIEMAEGSGLSAVVEFDKVPTLPHIESYLVQKSFPGGTVRNWASYGHKVSELTETQRYILADPQTSGGLLIAVEPAGQPELEAVLHSYGIDAKPIGRLTKAGEKVISVE